MSIFTWEHLEKYQELVQLAKSKRFRVEVTTTNLINLNTIKDQYLMRGYVCLDECSSTLKMIDN